MTETEVNERVTAWIRSRADWFEGKRRQLLRDQLRDVMRRWGATGASARGVLLDLVQEAWGPGYTARVTEGRIHALVVENDQDGTVCFVGHGDDRFVRALEASTP